MSLAPGITVDAVSLTLGEHRVFDGLSLSVEAAQWHALLGRSGVGKSSLLRLIAGLQAPDAGSITSDTGASLSQCVAYMSQDDCLLPWLSVIDNVQLGPRLRGQTNAGSRAMAADLLQQVDLADWQTALPASLSGGMRQRVALARTLLEDRAIVLMDEPFGRLDAITRHELQALSHRLLVGRTVVLVTHDPVEALRLANTLSVLQPERPGQVMSMHPGAAPLREPDSPAVLAGTATLWRALQPSESGVYTADAEHGHDMARLSPVA